MSPVFLLLVHADPQQAKRLLRRLAPVGRCVVHVDAKSDVSAFRIDDPRVSYVSDRVDVRWGAISQVEATLKLMRTALGQCDASQVSHFVLVRGISLMKFVPACDCEKARNSSMGRSG